MTGGDTGGSELRSVTSATTLRSSTVVLTRWVLVISIAYAIILSSGGTPPLWPHQVFIGAILVSNLLLGWILAHGKSWKHLSGWTTGIDIAAVSLAISIAGNVSTDFYLIYFSVLILAAVVDRTTILVPLALLACGCYVLLLYIGIGDAVWRNSGVLLRLPILLGVALYFGTAVQHARREYARQAEQLRLERGRALQALSEMGRLALTGNSGPVLFEIARWVQDIVGVDRCSLVVFDRGGNQGYLAATGDDPTADVLVLDVHRYPELEPALAAGEIVEIRQGRPAELWENVQRNLPETSPFRSFLVVPIKRGDDVLGTFFLRDARPDRYFDEEHYDFCGQAARMASAFIHEHELLDELRQRSRQDSLTGLLNLPAFRGEADKAIETVKAEGGPLTLVMLDIDNISEINDRWGHAEGDNVISTAGRLLNETLSEDATVCRYGGDEFIALVHSTKERTAAQLQDSFLDRLDGNLADVAVSPRASIGVASYPDDGDSTDALLAVAEQAMFLAKSGGGHTIRTSEAGSDNQAWRRSAHEAAAAVQARRRSPAEDRLPGQDEG